MAAVKNFDSKFDTKKITAAQYLAELMLWRKLNKEGVKIDSTIWKDKKNFSYWLYQKTLAGNLLKMYSIGVIIQVLSGEFEWVYSLNTKAVLKKLEAFSIIKQLEELPPPPTKIRKDVHGQTLFDKI